MNSTNISNHLLSCQFYHSIFVFQIPTICMKISAEVGHNLFTQEVQKDFCRDFTVISQLCGIL
ncbi:hypothetical protein CLOSTMETH_00568 [[Clostridium] methylpentosum DSM 5476]|uniref:Uncharacterized protein n=1 Tax=[Clostridium] methylpentosum DSM 5476 TaxID=537013 RepID=C0E9R8_9FIRM|nr:hypothetical protein CLOSTMETH_00568 [[Clostridium] methylpentosum DSM 5476]